VMRLGPDLRKRRGAALWRVAEVSSGEAERDVGGGGVSPGAGDARTWVAVASRLLEAACEGWGKLARVCVLLLCVAAVGVAWWWLVVGATSR
jgi:hypothetical protein